MESLKVYIITEGSSQVGFGHITRMLSIYQAFEERKVNPKFIVNGDDSILDIIKGTEWAMYNWIDETDRLLREIVNSDLVIVDSYLASLEIYLEISKTVNKTFYYDDFNRLNYPSGIVINGNIHSVDLDYPKSGNLEYLLGTKYLPLRREFWDIPEKSIKRDVETIMVTFGGDDVRNLTPAVMEFLTNNYPKCYKKVIVGKGFKNLNDIQKKIDKKTDLIFNADAKIMLETMLKSDLAISAGGQTLYELARVGVPTIPLLVAENQMGNVEGFIKTGFFDTNLNWSDSSILKKIDVSINLLKGYKKRKEISKIGRSLVDGNGSRNIVRKVFSIMGLKII